MRLLRKIKDLITSGSRMLNRIGKRKKCYVCGKTFYFFVSYRKNATRSISLVKALDTVESDMKNFHCMYCGSHDRTRHLFLFFDKLNFWVKMENADILHLAPEKMLSLKILKQSPDKYIKGDLNIARYSSDMDIRKIDATNICYQDNSFDFVIANHILEHIVEYKKALAEFYRILRPGGWTILQTPYSRLLQKNFEDEGIADDKTRLLLYGEKDHVRIFSWVQLKSDIENAGLKLEIKKHNELFSDRVAYYYGVNSKEDLILAKKMS